MIEPITIPANSPALGPDRLDPSDGLLLVLSPVVPGSVGSTGAESEEEGSNPGSPLGKSLFVGSALRTRSVCKS